jgi:predicted dehydrogenase
VVPSSRSGPLSIALVGPGSFASATHLPNIATLGQTARLRTIVARRANSAREAARRFAAEHATTAIEEMLADPSIDLVLVSTRHDLHAEIARRCLDAGKAVYLEKPAATDERGLEQLTVGFNRRFAPVVLGLRSLLSRRSGPVELLYRVNAGSLAPDHWVRGPEGGGRLVGEACHMIDLLTHLVGSRPAMHSLQPASSAGRPDLLRGDNFVLTLRHEDGSQATLVYTSVGAPALGKERIECHWDGASAVIDDFRALELHGIAPPRGPEPSPGKGHRELLAAFVEHVAGRAAEPIPWEEILEVSRFVLALDREARGEPRREP